MTRNQKIAIGVGAALAAALGVLVWRRRRRAAESDIGVCVEGATGPTACGDDDDPVPPLLGAVDQIADAVGIVWGSQGAKPPEASPGSPAWTADPPR